MHKSGIAQVGMNPGMWYNTHHDPVYYMIGEMLILTHFPGGDYEDKM